MIGRTYDCTSPSKHLCSPVRRHRLLLDSDKLSGKLPLLVVLAGGSKCLCCWIQVRF